MGGEPVSKGEPFKIEIVEPTAGVLNGAVRRDDPQSLPYDTLVDLLNVDENVKGLLGKVVVAEGAENEKSINLLVLFKSHPSELPLSLQSSIPLAASPVCESSCLQFFESSLIADEKFGSLRVPDSLMGSN